MNEPVETVRWRDGGVRILDQRRLPQHEVYLDIREPATLVRAIKGLAVRGAPALGITGAYGVALAAARSAGSSDGGTVLIAAVRRDAARIRRARPTAVNLSFGVDLAMEEADRLTISHPGDETRTADLAERIRTVGDRLLAEDLDSSRAMARHGMPLVPEGRPVLTHCNTGGLATGGLGTALGVARAAFQAGRIPEVLVDETRPLLQGGRLTLWELRRWGVPCRLLADGAGAWAMASLGVGCVLVGADRVAANGDTANKIGTYQLALSARAHDIPFFVVAPLTSFDRACPDGSAIAIEERNPSEVYRAAGWSASARPGVFNPAFDVTPAGLITAWITDRGVLRPPFLPNSLSTV